MVEGSEVAHTCTAIIVIRWLMPDFARPAARSGASGPLPGLFRPPGGLHKPVRFVCRAPHRCLWHRRGTRPTPQSGQPRPGTDDLVASTIWGSVSGSAAVPDVLAARIESRLPTARALIGRLYGAERDVGSLLDRLLGIVAEASAARSDDLRRSTAARDRSRLVLSERLVGYVCYVDRFADTLAGVAERLDYSRSSGWATCT